MLESSNIVLSLHCFIECARIAQSYFNSIMCNLKKIDFVDYDCDEV